MESPYESEDCVILESERDSKPSVRMTMKDFIEESKRPSDKTEKVKRFTSYVVRDSQQIGGEGTGGDLKLP